MVSDEHYELCLPILQDANLSDEDKTDKLEELLKKKTNLAGTSLENAILDAMWRFLEGDKNSTSHTPIRQAVFRRPSPASWRGSSASLSTSPMVGISPLVSASYLSSTLNRAKSSTASPFSSPRASPRLAFSTPAIPHSPNLNAYQFASDDSPATEIVGELMAENVEWLVKDEASHLSPPVGTPSGLNAAAPEFSSSASHQTDMSPYDMLRSILGHARKDDEIEAALSNHGYDLGATIASMMDKETQERGRVAAQTEEQKAILVGKSMATEARPATPVGQQKSGVICKYYMSTGQCLRADCRFSHDLSNHLCKYWVIGSCLAAETCVFSHDPAAFANKVLLDEAGGSTSSSRSNLPLLHDSNSFPSLPHDGRTVSGSGAVAPSAPSPSAASGGRVLMGSDSNRPGTRPGSCQQAKGTASSAPAMDDNEAFPSLCSSSAKLGKRHHGKRGGHGHKENLLPSSLAEIVKMAPSPELKKTTQNGSGSGTGTHEGLENSATARAIPSPRHIPWLETGEQANKAYLKARQEAIKHGGLRNKFLQSAAQAWNRNDARAAKALSLRGQSENELMRKAHREAARELYEERNGKRASQGLEIYVDLHGLHPEEAVEYLEKMLMENSREARPVYAITGTGHHSKNGKDKVGRAVRGFLQEWRYAYREFSVPGDRNQTGGILGVDARSWDRTLGGGGGGGGQAEEEVDVLSRDVEIGDGKVRMLVREGASKGGGGRR